MSTTYIIILAIAVIVIAIAVISAHSKHHIVYHQDQISAAIDKVFAEAGTNEMNRAKFLHSLQLKINCSHKDLLYLFGKARAAGLINADAKTVSKP